MTVIEGAAATLTCTASDLGHPTGNFSWLTPSDLTLDTTTGHLTLTSVDVSRDDGEYECRVKNDIGSGPADTLSLTVTGRA